MARFVSFIGLLFVIALAWLMGVEWRDAQTAGFLLGEKITLNEFVAYLD